LKDSLFHEYHDFPNFLTEDADESSRALSARSLQSPFKNAYVNAYQRQLDNYQVEQLVVDSFADNRHTGKNLYKIAGCLGPML
jgi:hypothetical protein